jgi:hypothetical protein
MAKQNKGWFDVDRAGLAKILRRKGVEFAVFELIQNAWDEAGVTHVHVNLTPDDERGYALLVVEDDAPEGFKDLRHAYTLFAESAKKANPKQRGRFNLGEKMVLSLCKWAEITTTKGTVFFGEKGRSETAAKTDSGTVFTAKVRMSKEEQAQVAHAVTRLIPPGTMRTTFNGTAIIAPKVAHMITATLPTEIADAEGDLRRSRRQTEINCYPLTNGDPAYIYEMGIPVVEHECAYHVDVMQKVPLTIDRENVTPEFLRVLRTAVFNAAHEVLTPDEVNHSWAQTAIESGDAKPEAVRDYMTKRFGERRVSFDMNDPEANNKAVAEGYTLVKGGMLTREAWQNVRGAEAIQPAGKVFPTHPGDGVTTYPAEMTPEMHRVRAYAQDLAGVLLGVSIDVQFTNQPSREVACWGSRVLSFNVHNLGKRWFDLDANRLAIDDLIIHEFGHHYESNHLSSKYNDALSRLAAKAMAAAREGRLPA